MKSHRVFLTLAVCLAPAVQAQTPNPTNLWSASLRWKGDSLIVGKPVKLTHDEGSNSQPSFSPDGKAIVFSAVRDTGAAARSDIYRIDLATGKERRVTSTPENENSPTVNAKGEYAAVRWVPATLFKEYGVWMYSKDGVPTRGVLPGPDTTGYYVPLGNGKWELTRPKGRSFTVAIFDSASGKMVDVDSGVPALPAVRIPGEKAISYVVIDTANALHILHRYDLVTGKVTSLGSTVVGRTANAWIPNHHTLVMARGNTLYARKASGLWHAVAHFDDPALRAATAYVVSPSGDRLILISALRPSLATMLRDSLEDGKAARALADAALLWKEQGKLADVDVTENSIRGLANERTMKKFTGDGVAIAELATKMWPASSRAFMQLGASQRAANDTTSAIAAYQKSLELNARGTDADRRAAETVEKAISELKGATKP